MKAVVVIGIIAALVVPSTVSAEIRTVPGQYDTIQAAIDASGNGDVVIVAPGTYTGDGNRDIDFLGKAITVRSTDPNDWAVVEATIIDCNGAQESPHRGFKFHNGETSDCILAGLTIINGYAPQDIIDDVGVEVGGAILCKGCCPTIAKCILRNNYAQESGGAIFCCDGSSQLISHCRVELNRAEKNGGGICCESSKAAIVHCLISRNRAYQGAGIYTKDEDTILEGCIFAKNDSEMFDGWGGGLSTTSAVVDHCLFWLNEAKYGGNIHIWDKSSQVTNCILDNGTASHGCDVLVSDDGEATIEYCVILRGKNSLESYNSGTLHLGNGILFNMDPYLTNIIGGDFHLMYFSPCLNAGDPNYISNGAVDMDGDPRVLDGRTDVGPDERSLDRPILQVESSPFYFEIRKNGYDPNTGEFKIRNNGIGTMNWSVNGDFAGLNISPTSGTTSTEVDTIHFAIDDSVLEPDHYVYSLEVQAPDALWSYWMVQIVIDIRDDDGVLSVPSEYISIKQALDAAIDGETVIVSPGIYRGDNNRNLNFKGKSIALRSIDPCNLEIVKSTIIDCEESGRGFHLRTGEDSNSVIDGLSIINSFYNYGSAIYCYKSSPTINHCLIYNNRTGKQDGGTILFRDSSAVMKNCMIYDNPSGYSGIYCDNSGATILNCTVTDNGGYGLTTFNGGNNYISNCIFWNNKKIGLNNSYGSVEYCDVEGGYPGEGNIDINPSFLNPDNDDYHLAPGSPCIDAGDPCDISGVSETDIDGEMRIIGEGLDIGADEYNPDTPILSVWPLELQFSIPFGGPDPEMQIVEVANLGGGSLDWVVTSSQEWLNVFSSPDQPGRLSVGIDSNSLPVGQCEGLITISDSNALNPLNEVAVYVDVREPVIAVEPNQFSITAAKGGPNPEAQKLSIWNAEIGTLDWSIQEDCEWLEVSPVSGQSSGERDEISLHIYADELPGGVYQCEILVSSTNATNPQIIIPVELRVDTPVIDVSDEWLYFYYDEGGCYPESHNITIINSGIQTLNWHIETDCPYIEIEPMQGVSTGNDNIVAVRALHEKLDGDDHTCVLDIIDANAIDYLKQVFVSIHRKRAPLNVPEQFPNIQKAIDTAVGGDVIILAPGIYTGPGNRDLDFKGKAITVRSSDPNDPNIVAATVIDCDGSETDQHRGFYFHNEEETDSVLAGLTITNGFIVEEGGCGCYCNRSNPTIKNCTFTSHITVTGVHNIVASGAAIFNYHASPTILNCTFKNNESEYGPAMANRPQSNPILTGCVFENNLASGYGGAIYNSIESSPIMTDCIFTSNTSRDGGAIYTRIDSSPVITNCTFTSNTAVRYGGALYNNENSNAIVTDCTFISNEAGSGGAVCIGDSNNPTFAGCLVMYNRAESKGAGFYNVGASPTLINCLIVNNKSSRYGGAMSNDNHSDVILTNCTIAYNYAESYVGGILNNSSNPIITNSIFWGNGQPPRAEPYVHISGGAPEISYCCIENLPPEFEGSGNFETNPLFADPEASDYHLKSQGGRWDPNSQSWILDSVTSLCIDAGDMESLFGLEPFPNGGIINMGAYGGTAEASKSFFGLPLCNTMIPGDINGDCRVDQTDLMLMTKRWLSDYTPAMPGLARNPSPADGATNVKGTAILRWKSGADTTSFDVYFGTSSPGVFQGNQVEAAFAPTLMPDTMYYWRIDGINRHWKTAGEVWRFTTGQGEFPR